MALTSASQGYILGPSPRGVAAGVGATAPCPFLPKEKELLALLPTASISPRPSCVAVTNVQPSHGGLCEACNSSSARLTYLR